jgi:hypothetical protein
VPVKEPWVTANEELRPLLNPKLGLFRVDTRGTVFYHSSGEYDKGYALCWCCGRADSMIAENELPKIFSRPHNKLRGKPEGEAHAGCNGDIQSSTIKTSLHLGFISRTDVFELYLKNGNEQQFLNYKDEDNQKIAWTLAVVLRQALADILGINADELGYAMKESRLPDCDYSVATIVLYDSNSGGSGFSSLAHRDFSMLFTKAREYLDCKYCDSVCQNCLLGFDTRFHIDYLDRQLAQAFLNATFINALSLPKELRLLGGDSQYCTETFFTEIRQAAGKESAILHIFLHGQSAEWDIMSSLRELLYRWQSIYSNIVLLMGNSQIKTLSNEIKEEFWWLYRLGIKIAIADIKENVIAQVLSANNKVKTFAYSNQQAMIPSINWMQATESVLVYSGEYPLITIKSYLDESSLKPVIEQTDVEVEILAQCNGALNQFAIKFWQLLANQHSALQQHFNNEDKLISIHYSDRYLYSPWTVILIAELIDGLKQQTKTVWNKPKIYIDSAPKLAGEQKRGLFADWLDDSLRLNVIQAYFAEMDEDCTAKISCDTQHGRVMTLQWATGKITRIRFDQGVGYWACDGKAPWFDNLASTTEQVNSMRSFIQNLKVKNHKDFATQVFVKERDK